MMSVVADWQECIRTAVDRGRPLRIRGGGTKDFYGEPACGDLLETATYAGIVDYDPTELVITARAGTLLETIESTMAQQGQMLAFEPPHFASGATLGGAVAAGLSGPRRPYAGAVRDLVLGVRVLDGKGEDLRFGGQVMKNVAGFDVSRLMSGAMGTLGVLLEISLKCLPLPRTEATRVLELDAQQALERMNAWGAKPLPISATCYHAGRLAVRLSGAASAVDAASRTLGGESLPEPGAFWRSVRDQAHPFFRSATTLWRLSVPSTAPVLAVGSESFVEWGGALRWVAAPDSEALRLRAMAAEHGGHATLFRGPEQRQGVFHPLPEALLGIHRRLKATFDPAGILNRGRLHPAF